MRIPSGILSLCMASVAVLLSVMGGCSTDGCLNNQNSLPLAGFYSSSTGLPISIDSVDIGGVGAPHDSLLHSTGTPAGEIYLPFRSASNLTSFYFHYTQSNISSDEFNDTVTFRYDSEPFFASEECGAMYRFRITDVTYTRHLIDSVGITDSLVTNVDLQRIKIFLRTSSDDAPDEDVPEEDAPDVSLLMLSRP